MCISICKRSESEISITAVQDTLDAIVFVEMLGKYIRDKNLEHNNCRYDTVVKEWKLRVLRTICEDIISSEDYDAILEDNNSNFDNELMEKFQM